MRKTGSAEFGMRDFYNAVGGDIDDVTERLEDIDMVQSSVLEFEDDPSYAELRESLEKKDMKNAFRAVHTLKGICYTFGLQRLGDCAAEICEDLRKERRPSRAMLKRLAQEYECVVEAIRQLPNSR